MRGNYLNSCIYVNQYEKETTDDDDDDHILIFRNELIIQLHSEYY